MTRRYRASLAARLDRLVLTTLRVMRSRGATSATAGEVLRRLPRSLGCPNDLGRPLCAVGVLGAMERVKGRL